MNTYCAVYNLNPDRIDEYIELHRNCWPEQLKALREAGAVNLEIYLYGTQCIITYECENFNEFLDRLSASETNSRWQKRMDGIFVNDIALTGGQRIMPLQKIFSLKKQYDMTSM